ncbi:carbohydrate kinase family protein [Afifella pfennigii]|uniref:carbohydrate kinase family protein n=1 Tax=Afifella pfennigii TaxID=209897 RepID=UPI0004789D42|nr:carbohydrate kinase [Afifella pfennigii]
MFLVCGEALFDLYGSESEASLVFEARMGGSPFNLAVGLARLGQDCALLTGLSSDALGERLSQALRREGVDGRYLRRRQAPTTLSLVELTPGGAPAYAFYGERAADRQLVAEDLPALGAEVWGIHAGSFSLVAEPVGSSLLLQHRREAGRRLLTLDPNVRPTAEPDLDVWRRRVFDFLAVSDVVKASEEDVALLYPGIGAGEVARSWLEAGVGLVVVTRGAEGAEAYGGFGRIAAAAPKVDVADSVGAGDAFMAALIAGLAERGVRCRAALAKMGAEEVLELTAFAAAAGAATCGRRGADLPRRGEIEGSG